MSDSCFPSKKFPNQTIKKSISIKEEKFSLIQNLASLSSIETPKKLLPQSIFLSNLVSFFETFKMK